MNEPSPLQGTAAHDPASVPSTAPAVASRTALSGSAAWARAGAIRAFDSLAFPGYRLFLVSLFFTFACIQMQNVASGWLVYRLTGSAVALGLMNSLWSVALFVLSPLGGVVADRMDRRRLVMLTYGASGVVALVIAALILAERVQLWHLAAASVLQGALFAFNLPGRLALIRGLVGERGLVNAMAFNSALFSTAGVLFPLLAGFLVDTVDIGGVYLLTAGFYAVGVAVLAFIPESAIVERDQAPRGPLLRTMAEGFSFVWRNRPVLGLFVLGTLGVLLGFPYQTLLPAYVADVLHAPASGLGLLLATGALGAFLGNMAVASQRNDARLGRPMIYLGTAFGASLLLLAMTRTIPLTALALLLVGLVGMPFLTINQALVQKLTPGPVQGRVMSLYMLTWGLTPVSMMPISALADVAGLPVAVAASGGLLLVGVLAIGALRLGATRL